MFYHGFENYIKYAFPEDELRPLSCRPLVRDRDTLANAGLNDVLGNYSLTLIDSLSSLAILSSSPDDGAIAWKHFQDGVKDFVWLYGDGSAGPAGQGTRSRGFDMDSKVQVFETVIRGLGTDLMSVDIGSPLTLGTLQADYSAPIYLRWPTFPLPITTLSRPKPHSQGLGTRLHSPKIDMESNGKTDLYTTASFCDLLRT
jgi:hypothetical protein